jgi:hypothetical protein
MYFLVSYPSVISRKLRFRQTSILLSYLTALGKYTVSYSTILATLNSKIWVIWRWLICLWVICRWENCIWKLKMGNLNVGLFEVRDLQVQRNRYLKNNLCTILLGTNFNHRQRINEIKSRLENSIVSFL